MLLKIGEISNSSMRRMMWSQRLFWKLTAVRLADARSSPTPPCPESKFLLKDWSLGI